MDNFTVYQPNYSIGTNAYSQIYSVCRPFGKKIIAIGGENAIAAAKDRILNAITDTDLSIVNFIWYGGQSSYENVNLLMNNQEVIDADMIFAIGGGKAIDTCKCLAVKMNKPVFTFPTIASTCAACTTVSIMYHPDGAFQEPFFFDKTPTHTFIQTEIIAKAPMKYMWAGIGDTYAKHYECVVSSRGEELASYLALGVCISKMCVDPLIRYGQKALEDNQEGNVSYELEQTVYAIIVSTAMVSILVTLDHTPNYNSGLAHAIFYALTMFPVIEERHLHGEVVGFGVLLLLLCDGNEEQFKRIYNFNKSVGLPTSLEEIEITNEDLEKVIKVIPTMPDIKHYPYSVTEEMLIAAFDKLKHYNNQFKGRDDQ
ncbi:iron-containing alcohol dehydrogenase family protein [Schinkia sp. CFF1]